MQADNPADKGAYVSTVCTEVGVRYVMFQIYSLLMCPEGGRIDVSSSMLPLGESSLQNDWATQNKCVCVRVCVCAYVHVRVYVLCA